MRPLFTKLLVLYDPSVVQRPRGDVRLQRLPQSTIQNFPIGRQLLHLALRARAGKH